VDKCTFCLHRVRAGKMPACAEVCPTFCIAFGDLNGSDPGLLRLLRIRKHKVNHPETGCEPRVYFLI
jgi:Fe-S-cluster-containing dehydrogenase component